MWNRPSSGKIVWLGNDRVVRRSPKSVSTFGAAEHAVVPFSLKIVTALQARNACGDLPANQVCEQPRIMPAQPQGESFACAEGRTVI